MTVLDVLGLAPFFVPPRLRPGGLEPSLTLLACLVFVAGAALAGQA